MKSKRGEGLTLQVIIIAVLCVVVMVVLLYIFGGKIGLFKSSTGCTAREGECMPASGQCPEGKPITIWTEDCKCVGAGCKDSTGQSTSGKSPGQCCVNFG